jgi:3-hydroxymyristoyl/3-hydroxydecanoyl-(acyl carrier protein) dehydratase
MKQKNSYSKEDLLKSGNGTLMGDDTGKLPQPPMLMVDRILNIDDTGGKYKKGEILAELDIDDENWFFPLPLQRRPCHAWVLRTRWDVAARWFFSYLDEWKRKRKSIRRWRFKI